MLRLFLCEEKSGDESCKVANFQNADSEGVALYSRSGSCAVLEIRHDAHLSEPQLEGYPSRYPDDTVNSVYLNENIYTIL